jgi:hypothetical protein
VAKPDPELASATRSEREPEEEPPPGRKPPGGVWRDRIRRMGLGSRGGYQLLDVEPHAAQPVTASAAHGEMTLRRCRPDLTVLVEKEVVLGKVLQESVMGASSAGRSFPRICRKYGANGRFVVLSDRC